MTQHSVVGRCIINPYLDNKGEIYKPASKLIGAFADADGDTIRAECQAFKTHKTPKKGDIFDPVKE